MWSRIARTSLVIALSLFPIFAPMLSVPVQARGDDACPEPNDAFQDACFLGRDSDALGFISNPNDVDAYHIDVLDFNTDVHVELHMPLPYKVELADWTGSIIATSGPGGPGVEVIDTTVPLPGAYYMFVHSAGGAASDTQPYTVLRALTYPGSKIPDILFSQDFRAGSRNAPTGENEFCVCSEADGRYTIQMKGGGSYDSPGQAWLTNFGPVLTDFTLTVDARVVNGADAGVQVFFRKNGDDATDDNTYWVTVDAKDGQVKLSKHVNGELIGTDWVSTKAVNTGGGVNRIVVRCFQNEILVNVNGSDIFNVTDDSFNSGRMGFGAIAWEDRPPVVNFDNLIITTPSEG